MLKKFLESFRVWSENRVKRLLLKDAKLHLHKAATTLCVAENYMEYSKKDLQGIRDGFVYPAVNAIDMADKKERTLAEPI